MGRSSQNVIPNFLATAMQSSARTAGSALIKKLGVQGRALPVANEQDELLLHEARRNKAKKDRGLVEDVKENEIKRPKSKRSGLPLLIPLA